MRNRDDMVRLIEERLGSEGSTAQADCMLMEMELTGLAGFDALDGYYFTDAYSEATWLMALDVVVWKMAEAR